MSLLFHKVGRRAGAGISVLLILASHTVAEPLRPYDPLEVTSTTGSGSLESFANSVGVNLADATLNLQGTRGEGIPPNLPVGIFCEIHRVYETPNQKRAEISFDPLANFDRSD